MTVRLEIVAQSVGQWPIMIPQRVIRLQFVRLEGWLLCIINGNNETAIGYNLALTNQTAKKIFSREAPTSNDSAITNEPGKA